MCPLDPISKGTHSTFHPLFVKPLLRSKYSVIFLRFAASAFFSKLTVNSNRVIFFSGLLRITISGLSSVVRTSAGIVPPFILCPGISMYRIVFSGFFC